MSDTLKKKPIKFSYCNKTKCDKDQKYQNSFIGVHK